MREDGVLLMVCEMVTNCESVVCSICIGTSRSTSLFESDHFVCESVEVRKNASSPLEYMRGVLVSGFDFHL